MSDGKRTLRELMNLLSTLGAEVEDVDDLVDELVALGEDAARAVSRRIRDLSLAAQAAGVQLGERVGGPAGLHLLQQLLQLGDESIENDAIFAIGNLGNPEGLGTLLRWLGGSPDEDQAEVLQSALSAIVTSAPDSWRSVLGGLDSGALGPAYEALPPSDESPELARLRLALHNESERRKLETFGTLLDPGTDELGRAFYRAEQIRTMTERLSGSGNRSLVLVGPTGSGKTSLIHELCRGLGESAPADLILQTSSGLLLAGTRFLGEWQTRVRDLLEVVRGNPRLLIHITDINNLLGAGTTAKSEENIADLIAPHIEKGEITLIGECTPDEVLRGLGQKPAFLRLFQVIQVEEALPEETLKIATAFGESVAQRAETWSGGRILYSSMFFSRLLEISDQFRSSVARPGRALDLLEATVKRVARETSAQDDGEPITLEGHHVIETIARESGVPQALLDDRATLDLTAVDSFLSERVIGQGSAVRAVVNLVTLIKAGLTDPSKPTGVLFFVGPTGVGKTELAKALAEYLFGSPERMIRLDMSEFTELGSVERLIGSLHAPEWSPHRAGLLTGRIREQPMSVVLLDEFEKAHQAVFDLLLQVMDDGRLSDAAGRVAHFTQAIVIMTSNVGGAELVQKNIGFSSTPLHRMTDDVFRRELERVFRPEFINRIDQIVAFYPLDADAMQQIVRREVDKVLSRSGIIRRNIAVEIAPSVIELLTEKGFDPRYGARPLKREVERRILLPLGRAIVDLGVRAEHALLQLRAEDDQVRVEIIRSDAAPGDAEEPSVEREVRGLMIESLALKKVTRALEQRALSEGLMRRKSRLVEASGQPAFWNDGALARRTLSEIHWLERLITGIERVRKRARDLTAFVESIGPKADAKSAVARSRLDEVRSETALLGMASGCRHPRERSDAFVTVTRIDSSAFSPDPVLTMLRIYMAWGRRHRYRVEVVDETVSEGVLTRGTVLLEGLCPYGLLRHERGIHRMVGWDDIDRLPSVGGRRRERLTAFSRVDVYPLSDSETARTDFQIRYRRTRGKGLLVPRLQSILELRHKGSDLELTTTSDKSQEEATDLLQEYATAMLSASEPPADTTPVRTYRFGTRPDVRDDVTGVRAERFEDVLAGGLEPFLAARLARASKLENDS